MKRFLMTIWTCMILLFTAGEISGQDDKGKIIPGVQWDTVTVVKKRHLPEHLIGIRYDYSFTGVMMTPDMSIKGMNSPVNVSILYTYYHPLWAVYYYFGLQTGLRYTSYGFRNDKFNFRHFEQKVTTVELPFLSAFHIDLGKHFRILASLGPFIGYRLFTTKDNGFDCFDKRLDYGLIGGAGVAFRMGRRLEFHLEGSYHYSLSLLYDPEKMSSQSWIYAYPWQASIAFGIHVKLN